MGGGGEESSELNGEDGPHEPEAEPSSIVVARIRKPPGAPVGESRAVAAAAGVVSTGDTPVAGPPRTARPPDLQLPKAGEGVVGPALAPPPPPPGSARGVDPTFLRSDCEAAASVGGTRGGGGGTASGSGCGCGDVVNARGNGLRNTRPSRFHNVTLGLSSARESAAAPVAPVAPTAPIVVVVDSAAAEGTAPGELPSNNTEELLEDLIVDGESAAVEADTGHGVAADEWLEPDVGVG